MILDTGTLIAIVIALGGSITVMCLFWKQNIEQQKLHHNEARNGSHVT